jgi:cardiolipin synthase
MFVHAWGRAFSFFVVAACSDFLDGSLARYLRQKTFLGACLDPIADKLLLISFFLSLVFLQTPLFQLPLWFVLLLLLKEMVLVCGACYMLATGRTLEVQPTLLGKLTTVVQMTFIVWLFTCYYFNWMPIRTYYCMLGLMVIMALGSLIQYVHMGLKQAGIFFFIALIVVGQVNSNVFISERPQQQKARSLRSLKREYGNLCAQQLRLSTTVLKEIGLLQSILLDTKCICSSGQEKIEQAIIVLNRQLTHVRTLRDEQHIQHHESLRGKKLQQQLAYMVEQLGTLQSMLIDYIEQLLDGDVDHIHKKKAALVEANIAHQRSALQEMQSLVDLLQQLQKECRVIQSNMPTVS